jgi:hypothetical protein
MPRLHLGTTQLPNLFVIYLTAMSIAQTTQCRMVKVGKIIPVTGRGGPYGCETSMLPHFLANRLTDGGEAVNLMRLPLQPRKVPGTHFC